MMAGQTINDRFLAAKHSIAGQNLAKIVCKATTEEILAPKKKHLDYLLHCTNEPNVSIPQLANLLIERSQNGNWIVVYKVLITTHHIMIYGNERFMQYMASSNSTFHLNDFSDRNGVMGYDMSLFIRRYARYLNEKALSYRIVAFDFCKLKKSKDGGPLRTMHPQKLLKTVPVLQHQLDCLLEFDCSRNDLTNNVISISFMLLFKDLIRLFACYNNGIINLLEKYFDMTKKQCKEGLEIYKVFLIRMDRVGEFLKVAENVGINQNDIPDLTKAPSSLLDALQQHLASMDSRKTKENGTASSGSSSTAQNNVRKGVTSLVTTSSSFGAITARAAQEAIRADEEMAKQALAEEEAAMNQFKTKSVPSSSHANGDIAASNSTAYRPSLDANANVAGPGAGMFEPSGSAVGNSPASRPSDDLLQLNNPFLDAYDRPSPATATPATMFGAEGLSTAYNVNVGAAYQQGPSYSTTAAAWGATSGPYGNEYGRANPMTSSQRSNTFVSDVNFEHVFGSSGTTNSFDALGSTLVPMSNATNSYSNNNQPMSMPMNRSIDPSAVTSTDSATANNSMLITGDLDSSIASLAQNLSITNRTPLVKEIQWTTPGKGTKLASGRPSTSTTSGSTLSAGYRPMNQSVPMMPQSISQYQQQTNPYLMTGANRGALLNSAVPVGMMTSQMATTSSTGQHAMMFH